MQAQWTVDLGATSVRYDELDARTGALVSPSYRRLARREYLEVTTSAAAFGDGAWSTELQGLGAARFQEPGQGGLELIAGFGTTAARQSTSTLQGWGRARGHLALGGADLWAGVGGGGVRSTVTDRSLRTAETGVTWTGGRWLFLATGSATSLSDGIRYTDATGLVRWEGRIRLSLSGGGRQRSAPTADEVGWLSASVEAPIRKVGTLIIAGGSFPADLAQDLAEGRYLSVSMRFGGGRVGAGALPRTTRATPASPALEGVRFSFARRGNGFLDVTLRAPRAARVEIAGDFSDWAPVPLVRRGDRWMVRVALGRGIHPVAVRIDGGAWRAPPGLPRTHDDFGGEVGLLTVD